VRAIADYWRQFREIKLQIDPRTVPFLDQTFEMIFYAGATALLEELQQTDEDIWPARCEELREELNMLLHRQVDDLITRLKLS